MFYHWKFNKEREREKPTKTNSSLVSEKLKQRRRSNEWMVVFRRQKLNNFIFVKQFSVSHDKLQK
jgi:hypothetical protein